MQVSPETKLTLKSGAWGIVIGAILCAFVGFKFGGWYSTGQAQNLARTTANTAVVQALTPVCVDKFMRAADAQVSLAALKAIDSSWSRTEAIQKAITVPGVKELDRDLADSCADALIKAGDKSAQK